MSPLCGDLCGHLPPPPPHGSPAPVPCGAEESGKRNSPRLLSHRLHFVRAVTPVLRQNAVSSHEGSESRALGRCPRCPEPRRDVDSRGRLRPSPACGVSCRAPVGRAAGTPHQKPPRTPENPPAKPQNPSNPPEPSRAPQTCHQNAQIPHQNPQTPHQKPPEPP